MTDSGAGTFITIAGCGCESICIIKVLNIRALRFRLGKHASENWKKCLAIIKNHATTTHNFILTKKHPACNGAFRGIPLRFLGK
jgi:hypothetical protein